MFVQVIFSIVHRKHAGKIAPLAQGSESPNLEEVHA